MNKAAVTVETLADLLTLHRDTIATTWARLIQQLPGAHGQHLPLGKIRPWVSDLLDALHAALNSNSYDRLTEYVFRPSFVHYHADLTLRELIEAVLLCKEAALPFVRQGFGRDTMRAYEAIGQLDVLLRRLSGDLTQFWLGTSKTRPR